MGTEERTIVDAAVAVGRHPTSLDRACRAGLVRFRWWHGRRLVRLDDARSWADALPTARRVEPPPDEGRR